MRKRAGMLVPGIAAVLLLCSFVFGLASARATGTPGVDPSASALTLSPGGTATIDKVVHTPTIPPKPDIVFLADTTGSMGSAIASVKANATSVMTTVVGTQPDAQFGSASYKDFNNSGCGPDPYVYRLEQSITSNLPAVQAGINSWSAGGGCDTPESWLNALYNLATDPGTAWRTGSSRAVALFGDAPSHDPSGVVTEAMATAALQAANIRLIAVSTGYDQLDQYGQATRITAATGGVLLHSGADVAGAILSGLEDLPATVTPTYTCDDPDVTIGWDVPSRTVASGDDAAFVETVTVSPTATAGKTVHCTVSFVINGGVADEFKETVDVTIPGSDVAIMKTGPAAATQGDTLTYHLAVTNYGPASAHDVVVTDTLPLNATFVSASAPCTEAAGVVTCNVGDMAMGDSAVYDVVVTAGALGNDIVNTATVTNSVTDVDLTNNASTFTTALNHNPVCSALTLSGPTMWPPDHRMVIFTAAGATDSDGNTLTTTVTHVSQDEALNGLGDGDTGPVDAALVPGHPDQVALRAERSGKGDGRVYRVTVDVTDGAGGSCTATLTTVSVPHDTAHPAVAGSQWFTDF